MMRYRIPVNTMRMVCLLAAVSALLSLCACAGDKAKLPAEVRRVVEAVKADDPDGFAGICNYPVERPYPLRDVENASRMREYYSVLVDDSLRKVVTRSPAAGWNEVGWRGWTLGDGEYLWIDSTVYNISYVSAAERELIDQLSREEMMSLPKDMRTGWHPATCLKSENDGTVFRIDAADTGDAASDSLYRMSIYKDGINLDGEPMAMLRGGLRMEGSAGVRTFYFRDPTGDSLEFSPDDTDDGQQPNIIWKPADGSPVSYRVKKVYWRDLIHPDSIAKSDTQGL